MRNYLNIGDRIRTKSDMVTKIDKLEYQEVYTTNGIVKKSDIIVIKGEYNEECYRTDCKKSPAIFYNHSTKMHYCTECAVLINRHNYADAMRLYGHELCTLVNK
jgi:hypothetical protein